jgi:hypothetical protein
VQAVVSGVQGAFKIEAVFQQTAKTSQRMKAANSMKTIRDRANPRKIRTTPKSAKTVDNATENEIAHQNLMARGRLAEAKKWFAHRGWKVLPRGNRGWQILKWGADHAWLAAETDWKRERSVRNWCRSKAPSLTDAELNQIVADTVASNKRWTHDQSATVLKISVRDLQEHGFKFLGADNDPNYEIRHAVKKEKAAARARKYRASRSTGAKRGRPASATAPRRKGAVTRSEWLAANSASQVKPWIALGMKRSWYYELKKRGELDRTGPAENASRPLSNNRKRDGISVSPVQSVSPASMRGAHQASPRQHEAVEIGDAPVALGARPAPAPTRPIVIRLDAAPTDGLILDEDGVEFRPPPPHQRRPAPKTWMDAAFEKYNGGRS